MRNQLGLVTVCFAAIAGCLDSSEPELATTTQDVDTTNGTSVNGTSVNGTSVNGTSVNGTSLKAANTSGSILSGAGPVGSTWSATTTNAATVTLRIDSAVQGTGSNSDLWFYGVSYQNTTGWWPLCASGLALPVAGTWDSRGTYLSKTPQYTWACRGATIAKCVELGYRPWLYPNQLATCTRAIRADYCGDGTSFTKDGTLINIYDHIGVQLDTEAWTVEAEWRIDGAQCITEATHRHILQDGMTDPPCLSTKLDVTCGRWRPGVHILTELPAL